MKREFSLVDIIGVVFISIIVLICLYPFVYTVSISFSSYEAITLKKVFVWPVGFNVDSYKLIMGDKRFIMGFLNSLLYTISGTAISIFLTITMAYPLSQTYFKYRKFFMGMVIFTMLFTGGIIPRFIVVKELGFMDKIWSIIIPNAIVPFFLILAKTFFQELPNDLRDAAIIDGCNDYEILARIIVPLSKPIIATLGLYYAVGLWNEFMAPLFYLNSTEKYPLTIYLRQLVISASMKELSYSFYQGNVGLNRFTPESLKCSALVVSIIPILLIFPFIQRYFAKGLMLGSIKG